MNPTLSAEIFFKAVLLYLVIFIPQLRLLFRAPDPHIGNLTVSRVSGRKLSDIFFKQHFGTPIPFLSLAFQYDFFKSNSRGYTLFHVFLNSFLAPLVYFFTYLLTNDAKISFIAALFYAIWFYMPITGNWLIQPDHYELLFFLSGACFALYGNSQSLLFFTIIGCVLLGTSQLCKLPGLASIWMIFVLLYYMNADYSIIDSAIIIAAYLSPLVLFVFAAKLYSKPAPKTETTGNNNLFKSIYALFTGQLQVYYLRKNPKEYIKIYWVWHFFQYAAQFLPLIFLSLVFFSAGSPYYKNLFGSALFFLFLSLFIRLTFRYTYSLDIILSITAALGLTIFLGKADSILYLLLSVSVISAVISARNEKKHQPFKYYFQFIKNRENSLKAGENRLCNYIKINSDPTDFIFINISNSYAYLYTLSERGFPEDFSLLLLGAYRPKVDKFNIPSEFCKQGRRLVDIFSSTPPLYVVESLNEWPIINFSYIEKTCSITYDIIAMFGPFILYRLSESSEKQTEAPAEYDPQRLFDADEERVLTYWSAQLFNQINGQNRG